MVPLGQTVPILQRQPGWKGHPVGGVRDLPFINAITGRPLDYLFHKNPQSEKKSYKQSEQVARPAQPSRGLTSVPAEPPPVVAALLLAHAAARGRHEVLGAAAAADPAGVLGLLLGCEDDGAARLLRVREGVAILLQLALREQVLLEAAVQGGPWGHGRGGQPAATRATPGPRQKGLKASGAALQEPGSPFRSSTRGLLGRLSEKLVLAGNLPPSTTSWDTTLLPLVSARG